MKLGWTAEDLYRLQRALDLYDNQRRLIRDIEFPDKTAPSISGGIKRLETWTMPEGTKNVPLEIEKDPSSVARRISQLLTPESRSKMPQSLSEYVPPGLADSSNVENVEGSALDKVELNLKGDDGKLTVENGFRINTVEELIRFQNLDLKKWEIVEEQVKSYQGQQKLVRYVDGKKTYVPQVIQMVSIALTSFTAKPHQAERPSPQSTTGT